MKRSTITKVRNEVNDIEDVKKKAKKYSLFPGQVYSILVQKTIKNTKKNYYKIVRGKKKIYNKWKKGRSFLELSQDYEVNPLALPWILKDKFGITKRKMRDIFKGKRKEKGRIGKEIKECLEKDIIQSPWGLKFSKWRGKTGEKLSEEVATGEYLKEDELRGTDIGNGKTPDILFSEPEKIGGVKINWLESKASLGTREEFGRDFRKQLSDYRELFGNGAVVYWLGGEDRLRKKGVRIFTHLTFHKKLKGKPKKLLEKLLNKVPTPKA